MAGIVFGFLFFGSLILWATPNPNEYESFKPFYVDGAAECPEPDETNRYLEVPLFYDLENVAAIGNIPGLNLHKELLEATPNHKIKLYFELGAPFDPAKKTIIIIPGGPGQSHSVIHNLMKLFEKEKSRLAEDYNLITMDHRGLGCSRPVFPGDEPNQALLMRYAASDIDQIRKHLLGDEGQLLVWGGSYGTMLAQTYGLLYPDGAERIFLWEAFSSHKDFVRAQDKYETFMVNALPSLAEKYIELKAEYPEVAKKFIEYSVTHFYSYEGRQVTIPTTLDKVIETLANESKEKALELLPGYQFVMPKMMRAISCTEIFPWKLISGHDYQMFPFFKACAEFKGQEEFFDYTPILGNIKAPVFLFSGLYDHVTPYEAMLKMHHHIKDSYMYLDSHSGHGYDKPKCNLNFMEAFFAGATDDELDDIAYSPECQKLPVIPKKENPDTETPDPGNSETEEQ